jgi:Family of unknown function (DUF6049)
MLAPMHSQLRRRLGAVVTLCIAGALFPAAVSGAAQEPIDVRLELLSQPVWHGADDRLDLRIRVVNEGEVPVEGLDLVVAAFDKVRSRSALHSAFDPAAFAGSVASSQLPLPVSVDDTLEPQQSTVVEVRDRISNLATIAALGEPGVFPVVITLRDATSLPVSSLATTLLYYPDDQEAGLGVVPIFTFNDVAQRGPKGTFVFDEAGRFPLEDALAEGGWIRALVDALEGAEDLPMGFAPTPRLVEELADMSDGYTRSTDDDNEVVQATDDSAEAAGDVIEQLRRIAGAPQVDQVLVPYSAADLPSIAAVPDAILAQINAADLAINQILNRGAETDSRSWVLPTVGRVDERTFEQLSAAGVRNLIFAPESLDAPDDPALAGCPVEAFSFVCPIQVQTANTLDVGGYVLDGDIQERLEVLLRAGEDRLEIQRFFAETAMIREELPGRSDRVLPVVFPPNWRPSPREARVVVRGLATAPWIDPMTPTEGLTATPGLERRSIQTELNTPENRPPPEYFEAVEDARDAVAHFETIEPPDDLLIRLSRNVLVAQSRWWWDDIGRGAEYAVGAEDEVADELSKIEIIGPEEITLTSKTGEIQFLVVNGTGYPVTIEIILESAKLDLPADERRTIGSDQQRLSVQVTTQASGFFPLTARLETPDGFAFSTAKEITVRSTEFNEIALGITFGALAFLVLFYVVRGVRRRRGGSGHRRAGTSAA